MTNQSARASLQAVFDQTADPALLATSDGTVVWANQAARSVGGGALSDRATLQEIFSPVDARAMLGALHYVLVETTFGAPAPRPYTAVVTVIDSVNIADEHFLILLKTPDPRIRTVSEREEFLGTAAHDLKNPIGAIFGYTDALLDTALGDGMTEEQRKVLSKIRSTTVRSLDLLRNYQHLAALQRGGPPGTGTPKQPSDLNYVVRSVIDYTWREEANEPELSTTLSEEPLVVPIDRIQLERVIGNLLSNAHKFTPAGGRVKVRTTLEDQKPIFEVTNSGVPLNAEELANLFKKYWRGRPRDGIPGSGLGLYIVKLILDNNGAAISVKSTENEGTIFRIEFPAAA